MGTEEIRQAIIDYLSKGAKTKVYFSDMVSGVKKTIPTVSTSEVKKVASELVKEGVVEYFSTGSTTMYGLKGRGISAEEAGAKTE
ncbi:MAG: sulfite reductase [Nitrospirae bacterium]|nr:sulfite reductase [Nitrospirota bacterium]